MAKCDFEYGASRKTIYKMDEGSAGRPAGHEGWRTLVMS